MSNLKNEIESIWESPESLQPGEGEAKIVHEVIALLDHGEIRVAEKTSQDWQVNEWIKKAVLLYFRAQENTLITDSKSSSNKWYDKIQPKFQNWSESDFKNSQIRAVPGSFVRFGSYLNKGVVVMPSFINIGAYVDEGTMIDTWATVGSCAQIGKSCHISGGTGIGGVLEPVQAMPVIIEDNCFIGARSEIAEGVVIEKGSVLSMGVFLSQSTPIIDRSTGNISYGRIPAYSVVIPGNMPSINGGPGTYAVIIVKKVDEKTRAKTSINDLLRP